MKDKNKRRTSPVRLKNGFYIEVCNKGEKKGIKIWNQTKEEMEEAGRLYSSYKKVTLLGEYKYEVPVYPPHPEN